MKIPKQMQSLVEDGVIDDVISQLMSGKEASVYIVRCGDEIRCAKVYKDVNQRSFKQAVQYREGRKVKNSRRARAMEKGSKFGRGEQESVWQSAEVDALYALKAAGVRVPEPYGVVDGVLLMELITDDEGFVAPRLNDVTMSAEQALEDHADMIEYIKRMLCAGIIHGDLSEFNVLVDAYGPVIIDLPQAVNASANNNAEWMFARDVNNMRSYYGQYVPELEKTEYAKEMWQLYQVGELFPDTELTGLFAESNELADVEAILDEIDAARLEAETRELRKNESDQE
ncbi:MULTISPECIES: PA4780 family RIO1-like protein kinase [Vibrio]|uniref:non-specific serine/threonine protein kinase n=1 Tax=Vibrio casei TaxID=673372 RepID=A0A368LPN5_9VIBR|nr:MULTISPECIES: PA4780 family RIO1-like protein kinase [Vibrio]RCS73798.1 serine protein kinase RIO [Vibrio casei]SJN35049.1 RIO1 protein [Vibrio casei]HBV77303.1 serine protein kinase RIO [Vibrio sp.]